MRVFPIQGRRDARRRLRRLATMVVVMLAAVACGGGDGGNGRDGGDDDASDTGGETAAPTADASEASAGDSADGDAAGADGDSAAGDDGGADGPATFADHLSVGECFDDQFDADGDYDYSRPPPVVDCSSAHDNEVIAIADLPGEPGAPYPGDDELDHFFDDVCTGAFDDVAGDPTPLAYFVLYPREDEWEAGSRGSLCATYLPEAQLGAPVADLDPVVPASFPSGLPLPDGIHISSMGSTDDTYSPDDDFAQGAGINASGWTGVTFEGGEVTTVKGELEAGIAASEWALVGEDQWRGDVATAYYALDRGGDRVIVEIWHLEGGDSRLHYFYPAA